MQKNYTSLGLMSGTSGDGVDASLVKSNGIDEFQTIKDKYFQYDSSIYEGIHNLKEKIYSFKDLNKYQKEINELARKITIFHAKIIDEFKLSDNDTLVGFHGQTIYHNADEKISLQLGDGRLLNQLTKKKIIFDFRKKDILNGGNGAPITPIFHQLIVTQKKIKLPVCIFNIGGISNATIIKEPIGSLKIFSKDLGPGNCLIDNWIRKNSNHKFDNKGLIASRGQTNEIILEQAQELYNNRIDKDKVSFDTNDFDISFARGLSLQDGAATLTEFTASILGENLSIFFEKNSKVEEILVCGGGRKNENLLMSLSKKIPKRINIQKIDKYGIDGDFVESQAFAFLAIRSYKKLPISFPTTTRCHSPTVGGEILEN